MVLLALEQLAQLVNPYPLVEPVVRSVCVA